MSDQRVTIEQGDLIIKIVRHFLHHDRHSPADIHHLFRRWCEEGNRRVDLSDTTVAKWCAAAGISDLQESLEARPKKAGSFYDFAVATDSKPHPDDWQDMLVRSATKLFALSDDPQQGNQLRRLEGSFWIIRRRWRRPDGPNQFIQCVVNFSVSGNAVSYHETERLDSLTNEETGIVHQEYTGYTFPFGSNIWIIAHEKNRASVKFLTIHHSEPPLLTGSGRVNTCRGNLIAVCGPGPNESRRFVLKRKTSSNTKGSYLDKSQLIKILYKEDFDYVTYDNEKENS